MSEDSGWADPEYFSGSDGADMTDASDYGVLNAAHPLDTAPAIEAGIDWVVDEVTETASDIYEYVDDLVPDFDASPGSDGGDGGGPPAYDDDGSGGAPSY